MQNQDIIKKQADAVQKFLTGEGVDLPRGKVLDMLARLTGDKEWNALSRRLKASAPGTKKLRYLDVLRSLAGSLSIAKSSLDDASSVVDPGEDEECAYEAELELLEADMKRVDRLIAAEQLVKTEGVSLFSVSRPDGEGHFTFLVSANVDVDTLDQKLGAWLLKRREMLEKAGEMEDHEEAEALENKWGEDAFLAEACRWGAVVPPTHRMSQRFD